MLSGTLPTGTVDRRPDRESKPVDRTSPGTTVRTDAATTRLAMTADATDTRTVAPEDATGTRTTPLADQSGCRPTATDDAPRTRRTGRATGGLHDLRAENEALERELDRVESERRDLIDHYETLLQRRTQKLSRAQQRLQPDQRPADGPLAWLGRAVRAAASISFR